MSDSIDAALEEAGKTTEEAESAQEPSASEAAEPETPPEAEPTAAEPTAEAEPDDAPAEPEPAPVPEEPAAPARRRTTALMLGAGESSRELALAFERLGVAVIAADRGDDTEELAALIERERPHYVVTESGAVAADALIAVAEQGDTEVLPTPRSIRLSQDREGLRRLASDELGLPTVPFWFAGTVDELTAVAEHAGYPLLVKPVAGSLDDGQSVLLRPDDIEPAWERATAAGGVMRVLAESVVEVEHAVTLLVIRTTGPAGPGVHFCEPIGHRDDDAGVLEAWQPQQLAPAAMDGAKSIAARIVNSLGGRGVFSVELLVQGDDVYFADVRVGPGDSGLVTVRSQRLSQFELHARAILGLAVDTIMISPAAAEVSYGAAGSADTSNVTAVLADALATSESDVRLFGRGDESDGRQRLGVALATAPDVIVARDRARRVGTALRKLFS
ncbi:phosphoribosylglycinamide formyltransferase 2 [Mycobacterium sp. 852013-50091_SCH5140682]|uniref:formate-dependent phosphoribosylglycinamide formyltransferase n=1 Tax=Mycobacterium sp. 852013-50091_SCH5140682 TaxID=1834109 RepID=UPI0007E9B7A0|nr:formate-dependent phosphoribosylglycinamide formyltransferase [Mycobacterium sp. 852013-50091_SCH5140682]OBC13031.1 phosphoribosylglycinamide formyltransferase 2 [Mycobacterium sp. 852013-50091_SCH5140682]